MYQFFRLKELYYLECDIGQSEFNPSGLIALHKVSQPLLGPPYTHCQKPEYTTHFAFNTPAGRFTNSYLFFLYNVLL